MAILRFLMQKALGPFFQRILNTPRDHKEDIMRTFMRAVKWWDLPPGDYLEFGVYRGRSFIYAYKQAQLCNLNMHFYAFDSFEGLPEVTGHDKEFSGLCRGDYSCDEESFKQALAEHNVDLNAVTVVPGFYDETLNEKTKRQLNLKRAAIVWIDCDIYESTKPVLDFITDYLTTGSLIAFDDWFLFGADPNAGEMRAAREWLDKNKHIRLVEYRQFGLFGQSFIVQVER
jgi:O-methyltransferase